MAVSRRFFLFGAGALTTLSFARKAEAFAARREVPLLIAPDRVTDTLYVTRDGYFYLGRPDFPEHPSWGEYFSDYCGQSIDDQLLENWSLESWDELDEPVRDDLWDSYIDAYHAPNALAFNRLQELRLGVEDRPDGRLGWPRGIAFHEGLHPGNSSLFVRSRDLVATSLLQARLNELQTGIEIVPVEEYAW
jgi:hypothetical protein